METENQDRVQYRLITLLSHVLPMLFELGFVIGKVAFRTIHVKIETIKMMGNRGFDCVFIIRSVLEGKHEECSIKTILALLDEQIRTLKRQIEWMTSPPLPSRSPVTAVDIQKVSCQIEVLENQRSIMDILMPLGFTPGFRKNEHEHTIYWDLVIPLVRFLRTVPAFTPMFSLVVPITETYKESTTTLGGRHH